MKKITIITIGILSSLILLFLFIFNYRIIVDFIPLSIKEKVPDSVIQLHSKFAPYAGLLKFAISSETNLNDLLYNIEFLPDTQYGKVNYETLEIKLPQKDKHLFDKSHDNDRFVIDIIEDNLILTTFSGKVFYSKLSNLEKTKSKLDVLHIENNLAEFNKTVRVLDIFVDGSDLLVSYFSDLSSKDNKKCFNVKLAKSSFNTKKLIFKDIYSNSECGANIQAGRIQSYTLSNKEGYLLSVAEQNKDYPNILAQNSESDWGKIIFIEKNSLIKSVFSSGHRNPQGLFVIDDVILETEHGPRGGDEINRIYINKNYGWPIASYGVSYNNPALSYKKTHKDLDFIEPIYSFIPSIGISEIRKLPNDFWVNYNIKNLFILSSLNGKSLFQLKFDDDFKKVIFIEKIFIGQRIRDIVTRDKNKLVLLALERPSKIAVLKPLIN